MAKITNPSKLLPSAKSTAITRVGKTNILAKTTPLSKGLLATRQSKDATDANNKLVKVDKFLKSDLIVSKKKAEVKRKDTEKEDFAEAEKKLETPQSKKFKLPGISAPSLGFMDRVKRFIFFTALGWALPKILEFLPKLQGFANIIGGVYNFAEGLFGKLFDGFMSLVKFGGDLKDKTLGFIATAKAGVGGNYQKEFDKLEKQFNTFVNASIIAGVLAADIGGAAVDEYNKWRKKNVEPGKPKPGEKPKGRPKVTEGRGGEKPTGKPKVTGDVKPGKPPGWWSKILKGPFAKLKGPLSRFAGAAVPGLGAAVGAADAKARFAAGDKIGGSIASVSAGIDGISTILALTGVGAVVAGPLSLVSMGLDAILLINDIGKVIKETWPMMGWLPTFRGGGRVVRRYQGGGTTRGGRPVGAPKRKGITPIRRKLKQIKPPKSQPGRDVGGENKIKKLYPNTGKRFVTEQEWRDSGSTLSYTAYLVEQKQNEGKKPNPYKALTTTAKILKDIPLVGGIMGAAVDIALGQKPDVNVYHTLSAGIGSLVENLANQKTNQSVTSLMRDIKGFAEGGSVPAPRELKGDYRSLSSGDLIAKVLGPTIDQRVDEAIQSIQKELQKRKEGAPGQPSAPDGGGGGGPSGGDFSGNTKAMKAFNFFKSQGYTDYQAAAIVGNLLQENRAMDPTLTNRIGMRGIAQWDANRWSNLERFAASKNLDPNSFETQLQFIQKELKTGEGGLSEKTLKSTKTLEDATVIFRKQYERPSEAEAMDTKRIQYAKDVLSSSKAPSATTSFGLVSPTPKTDISKNKGGYAADTGLDIIGNIGDPILSPVDGVLEYAESGHVRQSDQDSDPTKPGFQSQYSFRIKLDKPFTYNGKTVNYVYGIHLSELDSSVLNKSGIRIKKGQMLGKMGQANNVPHLHIGFVTDREQNQFLNYKEVREILTKKNKVDSPVTNKTSSGKLTAQQVKDLQSKVANLKPGDKPVVIPGIGSVQIGKDFFGTSKRKYFNREGQEISQQQFNDLMIKYKLPTESSGTTMQGGGLISPRKPNRSIPNSFAPYETPGGGMMIAIQPMIIEKPIPVSGGNKMITFPVPIAVNSNMDLSFSRG